MPVPAHPKIYHIVHVDRLPHIITAGYLYSDAYMQTRQGMGTTIGMSDIKARRLTLELNSHPSLHVGDCVPFYFCPRSVMLYLFYQNNHPELTYRGGQGPISFSCPYAYPFTPMVVLKPTCILLSPGQRHSKNAGPLPRPMRVRIILKIIAQQMIWMLSTGKPLKHVIGENAKKANRQNFYLNSTFPGPWLSVLSFSRNLFSSKSIWHYAKLRISPQ